MLRFSNDSTRSPNVPPMIIIKPIIVQFRRDKVEGPSTRLKKYGRLKANTMASKAPPKKPSHDFLGDMRSNNFLFPNNVPAKYAPVSLAHKIKRQPNMT